MRKQSQGSEGRALRPWGWRELVGHRQWDTVWEGLEQRGRLVKEKVSVECEGGREIRDETGGRGRDRR